MPHRWGQTIAHPRTARCNAVYPYSASRSFTSATALTYNLPAAYIYYNAAYIYYNKVENPHIRTHFKGKTVGYFPVLPNLAKEFAVL